MGTVFFENVKTGYTYKVKNMPSVAFDELSIDTEILLEDASTGSEFTVGIKEFKLNYKQVNVGMYNLSLT